MCYWRGWTIRLWVGWFIWRWLVHLVLVGSSGVGWFIWCWLVHLALVGSSGAGWFIWHWLVVLIYHQTFTSNELVGRTDPFRPSPGGSLKHTSEFGVFRVFHVVLREISSGLGEVLSTADALMSLPLWFRPYIHFFGFYLPYFSPITSLFPLVSGALIFITHDFKAFRYNSLIRKCASCFVISFIVAT